MERERAQSVTVSFRGVAAHFGQSRVITSDMSRLPVMLAPRHDPAYISRLDHATIFTGDGMKISCAALLALALPVSLAAQQPPAGQQANPITAEFRVRTLYFQRNIAQAFDSIPEAKFPYKPTPAQLTIGYIAQHLASDNYLFCNAFGAMKATLPAKDTASADSVKARWPRDTLVAKLKASFTFCETALGQLDDSKLADQVAMTFGGTTRSVTRVTMVLLHALDMADHYSQLANYMRLNNILPPSAVPRPGRD